MAKTVVVEFDVFKFSELPEGVTIGDIVSVERSYDIYRYFKAHFDVSSLDIEIEGGRVSSLYIDIENRCTVVLNVEANTTILEWAEALPELVIYIRTEGDSDGLYESPFKIQRSTLSSSLPALLDVLQTQDKYGFVIADGIVLPDRMISLKQALKDQTVESNASSDESSVDGITLNGNTINQTQLQGVNALVNELDIPKWIKDHLGSEGWIYIGDVLSREDTEPVFLDMADPRDGMDPGPWYMALERFGLKSDDKVEGWKRPETI